MKSIFLVLVISLLTSTIFAQNSSSKTVATVNGTQISLKSLETYHRSRLLQFSNRAITKSKSLDDLINREITLQKARRSKLDTQPEVRAQMENALYQAQIAKDLNQTYLKIKISTSDIETYYLNNPEYRTSLILLRVPAQPSPQQVKETYKRAIKIYQKVRENPKNFDAISKNTSQVSPSFNPNAPDIGFQPARAMVPEYNQAIKGKSIGSIVEPFRTQFGFNIVKVTGVKKFSQIDQDIYKAILFDIKKQEVTTKYFSNLVSKAKIKINKKLIK